VKKIVKIGSVDPEIIVFKLKNMKNKVINASKIYSPAGKFAEWAKLEIMVLALSSAVGTTC